MKHPKTDYQDKMKHSYTNDQQRSHSSIGKAFKVGLASIAMATGFTQASVQAADEQREYFCGSENPVEAQSIDTIIPALYQTVSGKAGSKKNWSLLKALFAETASVTPVFHASGGEMNAKISTVDEFIALNKTIFKDQDFFETEVSRKTFTFGHMANILSHYESRDAMGAEPYAQGINSFQLLNDGRRWCVISVTWDSHSTDHPIESVSLN